MNKEEEIKHILNSIPENFHVIESGIDMILQEEYINVEKKLHNNLFEQRDLSKESEKLFNDSVPVDIKKELLVLLGHEGSIESYRQLEKFYNISEGQIKQWTTLAIQECRMFLESELGEEDIGFISTGMGGEKNRLRFLFVIFSVTCEPFDSTQKEIIKKEYEINCAEYNSLLEQVDFNEDYSTLTILIPMNIAPDTVLMNGLQKCNELGNFIVPHYFTTNVEVPTHEKIKKVINEIRADINKARR